MSTLETRIEKLERKLRESHGRKSSVVSAHEQNKHNGATRVSTVFDGGSKSAKRLEAQEIDELVSDFGYLSEALPSCLSISADLLQNCERYRTRLLRVYLKHVLRPHDFVCMHKGHSASRIYNPFTTKKRGHDHHQTLLRKLLCHVPFF